VLPQIIEIELEGFEANLGAVFVTETLIGYVVDRNPSETIEFTEYYPTSDKPGLILSILGEVKVIKVGPPLCNDIVVGLDSASEHYGRV
jgi:hypothetical protein